MEEINEVSDILRFVKGYSELPSEIIYRGQNKDWDILPSLFRKSKGKNLRIEHELLRRLKLRKPILPSELEDSFDFLIFAQQHSMPTRLLDWTYNPLIALWFACNKKEKKKDFSGDGIIYVMDSSSLEDARKTSIKYNESESVFASHLDNIDQFRKLIPSPLFDRLVSQNGIFTVFPNTPKVDELNIIKVMIPNGRKVPILKELGKLKINAYTIFRDFDSLCETLYWEAYSNEI